MSDLPDDAPKPPDTASPAKKLPPEQVERLLKSAVERSRPSKLAIFLILLLLLGLPLVLIGWWNWPRAELPRLTVTAFDVIVVGGKDYQLVARLEPLEPTASLLDLTGQE